MPVYFDRFRFLNGEGGKRVRNESDKLLYVKAQEHEEPIIVGPGEECLLPESPDGETILDVAVEGL